MFINNNRFGISTGLGNVKQVVKDVVVANWSLANGEYSTQLTHTLGTDNLLISIYKDGTQLSMNNVEIINATTIKIYNTLAINCKIVLIAKE
ncbi:hypothetical protein [Clostridium sp.]|uniref:hypothetical protein n=1 Tax=Clostridium sp. TaxID=1506 RepID=UPI00290AEBA6|nr:hypothetical protein [Clostridium sp.]MDU3410123.1 hypothetical protein [Clostridium sp.]